MKQVVSILRLLSVAVLLVPFAAGADGHEGDERGELTDVWFVVPKQGMEQQFEEAARAHMAYRAEQGDSRSWQAYRAVVGDKVNVIQWRYCCFDWADQDAYLVDEQEKGLGAHWNENVHPYVDHYHHYLDKNDWEHSYWPTGEDVETGPYYGVTSWTWKMGSGPGPDEARKKLSKAALDAGWGEAGNEWLWLQQIGGKPTIRIVTTHADYAGMAPPEPSFFEVMSEYMGSAEEVGALFDEFGAGLASSDYTVWMHDESLSAPHED